MSWHADVASSHVTNPLLLGSQLVFGSQLTKSDSSSLGSIGNRERARIEEEEEECWCFLHGRTRKMAKRYGKRKLASFFCRKSTPSLQSNFPSATVPAALPLLLETPTVSKGWKRKASSRLWLIFDRSGKSELIELDKSAIMRRASIPARDLRILGPLFAHSARINVREKAMIINLEFIKAIITADEVLVLEPLSNDTLLFVDQLRRQFCLKSLSKIHESGNVEKSRQKNPLNVEQGFFYVNDEVKRVLPFEFQFLEAALEFLCIYLDSNVCVLARTAYAALDELVMKVSTKNLEHVRSIKCNLTCLLSRVQKVRDELEHLLDDNEDLMRFYLTRKQIQIQQFEALSTSATSNIMVLSLNHARRGNSGFVSFNSDDNYVEDLEILLETCFMQLERTRAKILSVREYIDYTEDYVNIQLDNQRNELIQFQLVLTIFSFSMAIESMIAGLLGMNMPCSLFYIDNIFTSFVIGMTAFCLLIFFLLLAYARWKKLLGS